MSTENLSKLLNAINYAIKNHGLQTRKSDETTPYVTHCISVASYLTSIAGITDIEVIMAAVLHDVVEDTDAKYKEIECLFGKRVASIVAQVSDDRLLSKVERKKLQVRNAPTKCYEAKLVKLADKLHNLSDLLQNPPHGWSPDIIRGYFVWSHAVVAGLRGTNSPLEEELDKVFSSTLEHNVPVLPDDLETALQNYYCLLQAEQKSVD